MNISRGLFNVPHVAHCYLINGTLLKSFTPEYIDPRVDTDVKFCQTLRDAVRRERDLKGNYYRDEIFRDILFI